MKALSAILGLALIAGCGAGTGGSAGSSASRVPPAPSVPANPSTGAVPTVTSTLKSGMVLTKPLPWTAVVRGPAVTQVEFLIDGKSLWTEKNAPYVFNDDEELLVPWLLAPGDHELIARATSADGQTGEAVASVTTPAASALPSGLVGTFTRSVTQGDIDRTAQGPGRGADVAPPGKWVMHLKRGLLTFDDPFGSGGGEAISATGGTLQMFGPPNWLLPEDRRGEFCRHEPPVAFAWKTSGSMLQISGGGNCADRDAVFVGTWRKEG
jgi:hypothetical protein